MTLSLLPGDAAIFERVKALQMLVAFYTTAEADLWLRSPQKLLDGRIPDELIEGGDGDRVLSVIEQLRDGAYV